MGAAHDPGGVWLTAEQWAKQALKNRHGDGYYCANSSSFERWLW